MAVEIARYRSELRDACEDCTRLCEPKVIGRVLDNDALIAGYRCERCRHAWWTSYDPSVLLS